MTIPWQPDVDLEELFGMAHETRYGHRLERSMQLVNVRVSVEAPSLIEDISENASMGFQSVGHADLMNKYPICSRRDLVINKKKKGPLVIVDEVATTFVAPTWEVVLDGDDNLFLSCG